MQKLREEDGHALVTKVDKEREKSPERKVRDSPEKEVCDIHEKNITLVTGNKGKLKEFKALFENIANVENVALDLPEVQGEPEDVAREKALFAFKELNTDVMVEDTSLCFNAFKGLPGVYIKWFYDKLGLDGLNKILDSFEDKSAYAQCIIAYMAKDFKEPKLFIGRTTGSIVPKRGEKGFGWDPIFQPDGFDLTYAEIEPEKKNEISHRKRSIDEMIKYFKEK